MNIFLTISTGDGKIISVPAEKVVEALGIDGEAVVFGCGVESSGAALTASVLTDPDFPGIVVDATGPDGKILSVARAELPGTFGPLSTVVGKLYGGYEDNTDDVVAAVKNGFGVSGKQNRKKLVYVNREVALPKKWENLVCADEYEEN